MRLIFSSHTNKFEVTGLNYNNYPKIPEEFYLSHKEDLLNYTKLHNKIAQLTEKKKADLIQLKKTFSTEIKETNPEYFL